MPRGTIRTREIISIGLFTNKALLIMSSERLCFTVASPIFSIVNHGITSVLCRGSPNCQRLRAQRNHLESGRDRCLLFRLWAQRYSHSLRHLRPEHPSQAGTLTTSTVLLSFSRPMMENLAPVDLHSMRWAEWGRGGEMKFASIILLVMLPNQMQHLAPLKSLCQDELHHHWNQWRMPPSLDASSNT